MVITMIDVKKMLPTIIAVVVGLVVYTKFLKGKF